MVCLALDIKVVHEDERFLFDGIEFSTCAMVTLGEQCELHEIRELRDALVVPAELFASLASSGTYLVFTSASGIADVGGYGGVEVTHEGDRIRWHIAIENGVAKIEFDRERYGKEIERVRTILSQLPPHIEVEPLQVVYPERW